MNILYVEHYAGSPDMGMEFRPYYLSREWVKNGNKVRIVAASFSHLRKVNPVVKKDFSLQLIDNIEYQWIKTSKYSGNGIKRVASIYQFVSKVKRNAKRIAKDFMPDIVICSSTYPFDIYAGRKIANLSKAKLIYEGHDLWPLTLIEIGGMSKNNLFIRKMARAEHCAYEKSDIVVSLLPFAYEYMLENGLQSKNKFHHIPNGIVKEDWQNPMELPQAHKLLLESLKQERFVVMYAGGHALSNKLDTLLDCAAITKDDSSIAYVLVGSGVEKKRLESRKEKEILQNVFFLEGVNKLAIPNLLSYADALYIGGEAPLYRYGISMNKVYDYMMAGKPIVYGVKAKNNDVKEAKAGIEFDFDDVNSLSEAIYSLKKMTIEERRKMGENGKKWVLDNCDYKKLASSFLELMK